MAKRKRRRRSNRAPARSNRRRAANLSDAGTVALVVGLLVGVPLLLVLGAGIYGAFAVRREMRDFPLEGATGVLPWWKRWDPLTGWRGRKSNPRLGRRRN